MGWRENLKSSQGGGTDFIRMEPIITFDLKKKENTEDAVFEYYHAKDEKRYQTPGPLAGIIIGKAMRAKYWDQQKEISFYSPDYFSHAEIVMFQSKSKNNRPVFKGTYEDAVKHFGGRLNQKQILYIATAKGLYAVLSNLTLSIDQLNQNKDMIAENEVNLIPVLYSGQEKFVTKKCKDILAKVSLTNRPCFVRIEKKQAITDKMAAEYNLDELIAQWKDYREQHLKGAAMTAPIEEADMNSEWDNKQQRVDASQKIQRPIDPEPVELPMPTSESDLPF